MANLSERIAYLKGLCDGLNINESKEGKVLKAVIDALGDVASEIANIAEVQQEMQLQVDDVEDAVADLEDEIYGDYDFDDIDDEDSDDWEDEEEYSFCCPECGEMIYFDIDMLESDEEYIVCPNCNKKIELEFDCDLGVDCSDGDDEE